MVTQRCTVGAFGAMDGQGMGYPAYQVRAHTSCVVDVRERPVEIDCVPLAEEKCGHVASRSTDKEGDVPRGHHSC